MLEFLQGAKDRWITRSMEGKYHSSPGNHGGRMDEQLEKRRLLFFLLLSEPLSLLKQNTQLYQLGFAGSSKDDNLLCSSDCFKSSTYTVSFIPPPPTLRARFFYYPCVFQMRKLRHRDIMWFCKITHHVSVKARVLTQNVWRKRKRVIWRMLQFLQGTKARWITRSTSTEGKYHSNPGNHGGRNA